MGTVEFLRRRWWLLLLVAMVAAYLIYFGYVLPNRTFRGFD